MRRVVKRSFTDSDIPTNGIDVRVDIADSKRDRSGQPESSNFFNVIEEQKRERPLLPHCPEEIRQRSVTEPTILRTAGSLPRVLSAVKELDKNLAEERLDELDLNNLAELDKRMALQMEERRSTPRNTPSGSPRKFTRGVRAPSLLKIAQYTAMSKRSSSTAVPFHASILYQVGLPLQELEDLLLGRFHLKCSHDLLYFPKRFEEFLKAIRILFGLG